METAIEAHVVILQTRLMNLFESEEIECESILPTQMGDAANKLKLIYEFLMKEESQRSKDYDSWKARLRNAMDKIEDEIETYLYNIAAQRQRNLKFAADSWVILKNKIRLFRAMRQFINTTDGLSKDQYLVHSVSSSSSGTDRPPAALSWGLKSGGRHRSSSGQDIQRPPPKKCDWSGISHTRHTSFIDMPDKPDNRTSQQKGKEQLEKELKNETKEIELSVVFGPDGVGKTAITRAVSNTTGIKGRFQRHVWVQMFKEITYKQLLLRILNQVTNWVPMNPEDMSEPELARLVCQQLVRNSILIVLEDAEDFTAFFEFLWGLINSSSGTRIIITTKNKEAKSFTRYPIELEPLQNHENRLFKKELFEKHANLAETIYKISGGLPLKISLLEKLLMYTDQKDWPVKPDNQNRLVGEELDVFKVCYNMLPPHLKPCFLYLCMFPKSFPIPIRRIIRLWIAEDMIQWTSGTTHQLEDTAECYLHDMVKRNLVEVVTWKRDGTPHAVHMNANLYDKFAPLVLTIGMVDVYGVKASTRQFDYVRWYVEPEYCGTENESKALLSNVVESGCPRSFVSFRRRKGILANDLGRFVKMLISKKNLGLLRVLDLEGVYKPYLENSLHKLLLLRYLGLRSTGLDSLPKDVGSLPYLDTLDIKHTNITRLPSSIRKMSRIRHLDLNGFHFNETQLKHFSAAQFIPSLRTLTGFYVACHKCDHIFDDNDQSLSRLTNLAKLGIHFQNPNEHQMKKIAQWIQTKLTGLRSLKLGITAKSREKADEINNDTKTNHHQGMELPDLSRHTNLFNVYLLGKLQKLNAERLPSCMRVLTLSMSNLVEDDPMKSLGGPSKFLNLIELRLLAECYKGKKMTCPRGSFPNLKVLKLWKISSLEEIAFEGALKNLEHLEIRYCPKLKIWELAKELLNRPEMREKPKLKELIVFTDPDHPSDKSEMQQIKDEFRSRQLYFGEHSSSSSDDKMKEIVESTHDENDEQREHTNKEEGEEEEELMHQHP